MGTPGLLVAVVVAAADLSDGRGTRAPSDRMTPQEFPRLKGTRGDGRYDDKALIARLERRGLTLEFESRPPGSKGIVLLGKRWVVGRTSSWIGFDRRPSKDYEKAAAGSESRVRFAALVHRRRSWTTTRWRS